MNINNNKFRNNRVRSCSLNVEKWIKYDVREGNSKKRIFVRKKKKGIYKIIHLENYFYLEFENYLLYQENQTIEVETTIHRVGGNGEERHR